MERGVVGLLAILLCIPPAQAQVVDLFTLDGEQGFRFEGIDSFDRAGIAVRFVGDVNGDEIDDIAIGADFGDPNGTNTGEAYVVFGRSDGFPAVFPLSTLDGTNGFTINGVSNPAGVGIDLANAIDFNGDGFKDIVVGAEGNTTNTGNVYVVFGTDQGFPAAVELSAINGTNGFVIEGVGLGDQTGISLDNAGDVNDDGLDDLIIGAIGADLNGDDSGVAYILFGSDQGFPAAFSLSTLNGLNGFTIPGLNETDRLGVVGPGADINQDGISDIFVGAGGADPGGRSTAGAVYVIFGTDQGFPSVFDLTTLNGSNGFTFHGIAVQDALGYVSGAGDVNRDGIHDIIVGAVRANPSGRRDAGQSYVVFGTDQGFPAVFELSTLNGTAGFTLNGISADDGAARVSKAGDLNNDGIDDFLIGAAGSDANGHGAGQSYLIYGTDQGFPAVFELVSIDGANGLIFNGFSEDTNLHRDKSGASINGGGDLNADGVADLVIGAPSVGPNPTNGRAYVVYGVPSFSIRLKRVFVNQNGVGKAVVKWPSGDVSTNKVGIYVDGVFQQNTANDNKAKIKFNNPNDGPFDIYLCEKNTTICSNTLVADFIGAVVEFEEDPNPEEDTIAGKGSAAEAVPDQFALHGNYPNPFNPTTAIRFDLPEAAQVRIAVYDMLGRQVMALPPRRLEAGAQRSLALDASRLASGTYIYRIVVTMEEEVQVATGRMVLMK